MDDLEYLKTKLSSKAARAKLRYEYYEMKNLMEEFNLTIPEEYAWLTETLGWCAKAVDVLADRMSFYQFKNDNFDLNGIYDLNNRDVLFDSAILEALITSCSFIYINKDENGFPKLQVINGLDATGIIDTTTNMLKKGYAILERDIYDNPLIEAYFEPGKTTYYEKDKEPYTIRNDAPYPLLVPVIYRPDAKRPFGHSRISRACISIMQGALRTLKRSEISAEFYSFPQKYVLGMSPEAEPFDKWKATISSFLNITEDEDGNKPTIGQFQQQSMSPYVDQIRMFAALFAGETGLTLDDLGFVTDNPSSAEAIKASHENLRLYARKAQKSFGVGFLNAGYLAACVRDNYPYRRDAIYMTKASWEPIFEPDMSMLSSIGDGAIKLNQAVEGYIGKDNLRSLTGIEASEE